MTLWLDAEDLFRYAEQFRRPSGIQRIAMQLYTELHGLLGAQVQFCRRDAAGGLRTVPWGTVREVFAEPEPVQPVRRHAAPVDGRRRRLPWMPGAVRQPLLQARAAQGRAVAAQMEAVRQGWRAVRGLPSMRRAAGGVDVVAAVQPGDVFAVLGSPWEEPDYPGLIRRVTAVRGVRTAVLVYDFIPLVRPEWCDRGLTRAFGLWFTGVLPLADDVLAISAATAQDVEGWAAEADIALRAPVRVVPLGTGLPDTMPGELPSGLRPGGYVLFVSTIEARKNHLLAFHVWRRLLDEMPRDTVPTLVFAGRVGWLADDLMQQLANCDYLGGKVVHLPSPTDAELAALYAGCRFSLFPSFYEGWGLPVSESLAMGKVCVASDRSAVPEAGGAFCLYVDPGDVSGAVVTIGRALTEPDLIAGLERKIAAEFRPVTWRTSAEAVLRQLGL